MGYTSNESRVRIDIIKKSGKWYASGSVDMAGVYDEPPDMAVMLACENEFLNEDSGEWPTITSPENALDSYVIICLEPHCEHAYPVMITKERWSALKK